MMRQWNFQNQNDALDFFKDIVGVIADIDSSSKTREDYFW